MNTEAAIKVSTSMTLAMLMEHDHQKNGDIISEAKAQGMVLGLINGTLAICDDDTAQLATELAKMKFDTELAKRAQGEAQMPAEEVIALELPQRRVFDGG